MMNTPKNHQQKIVPYLWFDDQAEVAASEYVRAFSGAGGQSGRSRITGRAHYGEAGAQASGQPAGSVMTVEFELAGFQFVALNGGPAFRFNPAISFYVHCSTEDELSALWDSLSAGGDILMPLDRYPFSEKFGWTTDRFGVSWQLSLSASEQKISPFLMFVGEQFGRAEEAVRLYTSLFDGSEIVHLQPNEADGTLFLGTFLIAGEQFMAIDSGAAHAFAFNEAISFLVRCQDQAEVDRVWTALTAGGEEGPCGWLKDPFGVSWQIVPAELMALLSDPDPGRAERAMAAMLKMKKIEIAALKHAADQV